MPHELGCLRKGKPDETEVHATLTHQEPLPVVETVCDGAGQMCGSKVVGVTVEMHLALIYDHREHVELFCHQRSRSRQPDFHLKHARQQ